MIKIIKNIKGFAMAELLAICIVILVIFSILFSNYLPLLAEYEKRISYNDVTAQYAAHYVRKMYYNAFSDPTTGTNNTEVLEEKLNTSGFDIIYNKETNNINKYILTPTDRTQLNNLIAAYGIEEIIITKYQLKGKDTDATYVKEKYSDADGSLYSYINYLPNYEKSIYTGANSEENMQLYRIILKTKDYGYATTPIFYDYKTPSSCFTAKAVSGGLEITGYDMTDDECGEIVTISSKRLTISGHTGVVVAIGDNAFKDKAITEVIYNSEKLKTIGDNAFQGTSLTRFDLEGLTSVGAGAFSKINTLTEITIPNGVYFGNGAFKDNPYLSTIDINTEGKITKDGTIEPESLFENCANGLPDQEEPTPISVVTKKLTSIPKAMFKDSYITSITFEEGLSNIGDSAFGQDKSVIGEYKSKADSLNLPTSLTNIGEGAFKNFGLNIPSLDFANFTNSISIGGASFEGITAVGCSGIGELTITDKVTALGSSAFANADIKTLNLDLTSASQLTSITHFTFKGNKELNNNITLEIPNNIITIGEEAFANTSLEKGIILPENLATIRNGAFRGTSLKSITIPKSITSIPNDTFNTSTSLKEIVIPDHSKLTTIGARAFQNIAIEKFTIPSSVTSIGENAFFGCKELAKAEGDLINNSNISVKWCDIFAVDTDQTQILSCSESVSGNIVTMIYNTKTPAVTYTKYITNGSGE